MQSIEVKMILLEAKTSEDIVAQKYELVDKVAKIDQEEHHLTEKSYCSETVG
jgi:hypothetical protein